MNCEEFTNALVVRIYGELDAEQEQALQDHATRCERCAQALARTLDIHHAMDAGDPAPEPDWEFSWRVIRARSRRRRWRLPALFEWSPRPLGMAVTVVALVFVLGVLAGRSLFFPAQEPGPVVAERSYRNIVSVAAYTETLEPLLIDFMNSHGRATDEEVAAFTRRVLVDMLAETRLFKRAAERDGDERLSLLLEDIELVLISIANLGGQNGDVAEQLEQVIRDKSIMYRLKQLPTASETI